MESRRYRLVCFDLDGTILDNEFIWTDMHLALKTDMGKRKEAAERFRKKEISYQEWADHDIEMFVEQGAKKQDIINIAKKIRFIPGAIETLRELKRRGYRLAVISGSVDTVLEAVMPDYKRIFDDVLINSFVYDRNGALVGCRATEFDFEHKALGLRKLAEEQKISTKDCAFIGDHLNDIEIASEAGFSIAFNSKSDRLNQVADVIIKEKDLRRILSHL
ncbi:HAD family phosphatase [Candidatus Woesearchaeota archaeon]|nr:HAD family phosphatase [Candidatus Woesearchaeota archaeon]